MAEQNVVHALFQQIEHSMPDFKARPQQMAMSEFIAERLQAPPQQRMAVVEAPTGVGKTLAYLAGIVDIALATKKTMVISTATVNLQQQLLQKDLPLFRTATDKPLKFVEAKGRRRYLCPSKLLHVRNEASQESLAFSDTDQHQQQQLKRDSETLYQRWQSEQWDGDRDSYQGQISMSLWHQVSTDSEGCSGKHCSNYLRCPYYLVRKDMLTANIIVANHDLVLSDADLGGGLVLPNPEEAIFVFDEAHNLPQKALDHAAKALDFYQLAQTIELANNVLKKIPKALLFRQHDFGFMLTELRRDLPAMMTLLQQMETLLESDEQVQKLLAGELSEQRLYWQSPIVEALITPCHGLLQRANTVYKHYVVFARWIKEGLENQQIKQAVAEVLLPQVGTVQNIIGYLIDFMGLFLDPDQVDRPPNVRWLAYNADKKHSRLIIHAGPMTAAFFLEQTLWNRAYGTVLTSATLRGMGLFRRFRTDCGLRRFTEPHFLAVKSPFDYQKQAILSLPQMQFLPSEHTRQWQQEVVEQLPHLIDLSEATLVLFTSKQVMDYVYHALPQIMQQQILLQGDVRTPKQMVIEHNERIAKGEGSVLFGMDRFAEGVDLPGNLCSHVIITKLPFPVFTRPIEQAKQEWVLKRGGQPFISLSLPAVSMKLIQACGRLLRKETDSGKITILDRRLLTKAYGKQLLTHLPDYRIERG